MIVASALRLCKSWGIWRAYTLMSQWISHASLIKQKPGFVISVFSIEWVKLNESEKKDSVSVMVFVRAREIYWFWQVAWKEKRKFNFSVIERCAKRSKWMSIDIASTHSANLLNGRFSWWKLILESNQSLHRCQKIKLSIISFQRKARKQMVQFIRERFKNNFRKTFSPSTDTSNWCIDVIMCKLCELLENENGENNGILKYELSSSEKSFPIVCGMCGWRVSIVIIYHSAHSSFLCHRFLFHFLSTFFKAFARKNKKPIFQYAPNLKAKLFVNKFQHFTTMIQRTSDSFYFHQNIDWAANRITPARLTFDWIECWWIDEKILFFSHQNR